MNDVPLLLVTFLAAAFTAWSIILCSHRWHWFDVPNARSSHATPTATGGGIAFAVVFILATWFAFRYRMPGENFYLILVLGGGISLLGMLDDIFRLGIGARIGSQLLVVVATLWILGVPDIPLFDFVLKPGWASFILLSLALLWFINLFNFMDGIDGIAALEAIFICAGILVLTLPAENAVLRILLPLLIAAVAGFLVFNIPPARLFMGDAGSNFLGYFLGVVCLLGTTAGLTSIWVWCILAGAFITDATYTLLARIASGDVWFHAHRTHAYQLAVAILGSHGRVVATMTGINVFWLLPMAWLAMRFPAWGLAFTVAAWLPLVCLAHVMRRRLLN